MEGKHLVVLCNISFGNRIVATHALIDCGATGIAFVDEDFARHHQLPLTPLQYPRSLKVIDGRPISSGDITHVANTHLAILEHQQTLLMFITKLSHYPVVLSILLLELHDVAIRFSSRTLTFGSQYCTSHCNRAPTVVHAHSLASKIAHEEPVVSAGAGEFEARSFTSPKSFFQNQVDHGKDYNLGMGARSSNWRARRLPISPGFPDLNAEPLGTSTGLPNLSAGPLGTSTGLPNSSAGLPQMGASLPDASTPDGPKTRHPIQISAIGGQPF